MVQVFGTRAGLGLCLNCFMNRSTRQSHSMCHCSSQEGHTATKVLTSPHQTQDRHNVSRREILVSFVVVVLVKFHVKQQSSDFFNLSKTSKSNDLRVFTKPILPGSVLSHLTRALEFQALPFARKSPWFRALGTAAHCIPL